MAKINLSNINVDATTFGGFPLIYFLRANKTSKDIDINSRGNYTCYAYKADTGLQDDGILFSFWPVDNYNGVVYNMNYGAQILITFFNHGTYQRSFNGDQWQSWKVLAWGGVKRCLPISYAILQKGGLHNGKGEYSGYNRTLSRECETIPASSFGQLQPFVWSRFGIGKFRRPQYRKRHLHSEYRSGSECESRFARDFKRGLRPSLCRKSREANICSNKWCDVPQRGGINRWNLETGYIAVNERKEAVVA